RQQRHGSVRPEPRRAHGRGPRGATTMKQGDSRSTRWSFDDSGQIAGIEALPFGFLIFVVVLLMLGNAWAVIDAKVAVTAAAREASRVYVESLTGDKAEMRARAAAAGSIRGHGRDPSDLTIEFDRAGGFGRCVRIEIEASLAVPSI